ncbi:Solute carrier family 35 member F5 [Chionoecetes opilio]|uniref:Solute carrier family 35 member F5 n=1 Tax=Chionoecetes opilio TaxID=41210 RepID=A0A8J4XXA6_CHIOP|nr:Solute carrier family 35 member F5 [Chionoecetes opilio]
MFRVTKQMREDKKDVQGAKYVKDEHGYIKVVERKWFAGNYAYQIALSDTEAGVVNVISSASGLFTLILAAIFPSSIADKFTISKLVSVLLMVVVTIVPVKILLRLAFREGYLLKSDYEADSENITEVRLQKGRAAWSRKVFDLSAPRLPKHYSRPLALKKEKVRDLQYLLDLMPVNKQTFYNTIIDAHTVGLTEDVPPDEDPDDLDELLEYE